MNEVKEIVLSLKETATGYDDIGAVLLKMSVEYIGNPLSHICNSSFLEGMFPDSVKLLMSSLCTRQRTQCVLIIIDLYHYYVSCQKSLKD